MPRPILTLKLRVPSPRPDEVSRPRLMAQLDEIWRPDKRLLLVCAPAGYGKTSLIASWLAHRRPAGPAAREAGTAWLALDPADNDFPRFWLGLVEALKSALTPQQYQACRAAGEPVDGSAALSAPDMAALLLNALSDLPDQFILVLDDYQDISQPAIHDCVRRLLANLPPALRLVIATRVDPPLGLAQLRARNQLVEIRTAALEFNISEAADFLNRTFGLALTDEQISVLASRTEGWAAGLQMAGLSLQGRPDPAAFIQAFGGSQRFILEYLIDEVLSRQAPEVQDFLLRTSIYERFCAEACDALLDQPSASLVTLAALERMNLFLVPLDEDGRWYRYHRLFASLLRGRLRQLLDPAEVEALYRRARQWYESQGLLAEAVAQALAAPDGSDAADLLERVVLTFFYHGEITQVHRWLDRLPPPIISRRALLCAVNGAAIALLPPYAPQSLPAAEEWMQAAEQALAGEAHPSDLTRAFIYTIRSYWARFRGEPAETVLPLIASALALLPPDEGAPADGNHLRLRSALQANLGFTYWTTGDEPAARQAFIETRRLGRAADDLFNESAATNFLITASYLRGQLPEAAALAREALAYFDSQYAQLGHRMPYSGEIGIQLAEILIERHELDEAEQVISENLELAKWTLGENILFRGHLALARLTAARGEKVAAFEHLAQAEQAAHGGAELVGAQRGLLWLALGGQHADDLARARQWADGRRLTEFRTGRPQMEWAISLALARLLAAGQGGGGASLLAWLARQRRAMQTRGWAHWQIQLEVVECLARRAAGDAPGALAALRRALVLAAPGGYRLIFIEAGEPLRGLLESLEKEAGPLSGYAQQLRLAFAEPAERPGGSASGDSDLIEPLTRREREVLGLICQGLSNQAIADRLVVTLSTVKKHNYSIFGKLGVDNRAQAIVRAHELGLIG